MPWVTQLRMTASPLSRLTGLKSQTGRNPASLLAGAPTPNDLTDTHLQIISFKRGTSQVIVFRVWFCFFFQHLEGHLRLGNGP